MLVWVLASNPSVLFYKQMGGVEETQKTITLANEDLLEVAFGWPDIGAFDTHSRHSSFQRCRLRSLPTSRLAEIYRPIRLIPAAVDLWSVGINRTDLLSLASSFGLVCLWFEVQDPWHA